MNKKLLILLLVVMFSTTLVTATVQNFDANTRLTCYDRNCNITSETGQVFSFTAPVNTTLDTYYQLRINRTVADCVGNFTGFDTITNATIGVSNAANNMSNVCMTILNSFNSSMSYYSLYATCYANLSRMSDYDLIKAANTQCQLDKNTVASQLTNYQNQVNTLTAENTQCTTDKQSQDNQKWVWGAIGAALGAGALWFFKIRPNQPVDPHPGFAPGQQNFGP